MKQKDDIQWTCNYLLLFYVRWLCEPLICLVKSSNYWKGHLCELHLFQIETEILEWLLNQFLSQNKISNSLDFILLHQMFTWFCFTAFILIYKLNVFYSFTLFNEEYSRWNSGACGNLKGNSEGTGKILFLTSPPVNVLHMKKALEIHTTLILHSDKRLSWRLSVHKTCLHDNTYWSGSSMAFARILQTSFIALPTDITGHLHLHNRYDC